MAEKTTEKKAPVTSSPPPEANHSGEGGGAAVGAPASPAETDVPPPDLVAEMRADLAQLEKLDWMAACIKRFQRGIHPDPAIEGLLSRRMGFSGKRFLAAYPLRLLCTWAMVFIFCSVFWGGVWIVFSILGHTDFLKELSVLISLLMFALFGIGGVCPIRLYDEKALEKAGSDQIRLLRLEIAEEAKSQDYPSPRNS